MAFSVAILLTSPLTAASAPAPFSGAITANLFLMGNEPYAEASVAGQNLRSKRSSNSSVPNVVQCRHKDICR